MSNECSNHLIHLVQEFELTNGASKSRAIIGLIEYQGGGIDAQGLLLHPNEIKYLNSLEFEKRKREFYITRVISKLSLCKYYDLPIEMSKQIEIRSGVLCQPIVRTVPLPYTDPVGISISHSGEVGAVIIAPTEIPVGLDIECASPSKERSVRSALAEIPSIAMPQSMESVQGCLIWALMEALAKAIGCGFSTPLEVYHVSEVAMNSENIVECKYSNFSQFKGHARIFGNRIFAVAVPSSHSLGLGAVKLGKFFAALT